MALTAKESLRLRDLFDLLILNGRKTDKLECSLEKLRIEGCELTHEIVKVLTQITL